MSHDLSLGVDPPRSKVGGASLVLRSIPAQMPEWTDTQFVFGAKGEWTQVSLVVPPDRLLTSAFFVLLEEPGHTDFPEHDGPVRPVKT